MVAAVKTGSGFDLHTIQQMVKWTVYLLLVINFGFYIYEDVDRAIHTLHAESTLFDWTSEFATTIAIAAWFLLLAMFELQTYILEDRHWKPWVARTVHGIRIACYIMIAHTVIAFADGVIEYSMTIPVDDATSLCDLVDDDLSFVYNLEYVEVTEETCTQLTDETQFYRLGPKDPLVSTYAGLKLERALVWSDLIEVIVWLIIIAAIETVVRLQEREITGGRLRSAAQLTKLAGYGVLFVLAAWWGSLGHWLYTWDTFIWVAGFAAIEMNVSEWRDEILSEEAGLLATAAAVTED